MSPTPFLVNVARGLGPLRPCRPVMGVFCVPVQASLGGLPQSGNENLSTATGL